MASLHLQRIRLFETGLQFLILIAFIYISLGVVFARGTCCGDDAHNASTAKNLASGVGYASTIQEARAQYSVRMFDPRLGVGPTIIIPAALVIRLVGNTYWAPGITIVSMWTILLLLIGLFLHKFLKEKISLTGTTITFFVLSYVFMAYHFEQWYALLGEVPAALLIVLAILVYFDRDSKINLFFTGLLFSLACYAKLIAFLPFALFLLFITFFNIYRSKNDLKFALKKSFLSLFFILLGFVIPIAVFELWKLVALGLNGYMDNWTDYLRSITKKGGAIEALSINEAIQRIDLIKSRFGIYLPNIFLIFTGIGFLLRKEKKLFLLFSSLCFIIFLFSIYWLFFSVGWARYYVLAVILIIVTLTLPFLSTQAKRIWVLLYTLVLVSLTFVSVRNINMLYPFHDIQLYQPDLETRSLAEISGLLSSQGDKKPFITQWWATAADIEYTMKTQQNFTTYWDPIMNTNKSFILVANSKFLEFDDKYKSFLEYCRIDNIGLYIYGECNMP